MKNTDIIVGVDAGSTVGIAILDINGDVIAVFSKKFMKKGEMVEKISEYGNPLIIATDVNPPPKSVSKLASTFGCTLFYPEKSLSYREKFKLTEKYRRFFKDKHQRDALASALRAFRRYHPLFIRTKEVVKEMGVPDKFKSVLRKLMERKTESIKHIVRRLFG